MTRARLVVLAFAVAMCPLNVATAEVVKIEIVDRAPILEGASFGAVGPYERIVGRVHFEVDPALPANRLISDIDLGRATPAAGWSSRPTCTC